MSKQLDQETQVGKSDQYNDTLTPGAPLQSNATDLRFDLNAIRTQLRRIIHGLGPGGSWHDDPGNVFGADSSLKALFFGAGGGGAPGHHAQTHEVMGADPVGVGQFRVPETVEITHLVCTVGSYAAEWADNSVTGKAPVVGMVVAKPTPTLAIVAYRGTIIGFTGLIPGSGLYLGTSGGIITPPLPTSLGIVIQRIGQALSESALLLDPEQPIIL
jgi:hypothetical protein